jgi:hypothetical protein
VDDLQFLHVGLSNARAADARRHVTQHVREWEKTEAAHAAARAKLQRKWHTAAQKGAGYRKHGRRRRHPPVDDMTAADMPEPRRRAATTDLLQSAKLYFREAGKKKPRFGPEGDLRRAAQPADRMPGLKMPKAKKVPETKFVRVLRAATKKGGDRERGGW